MSKICMASANENEKPFSEKRLQERFPEIPDSVIAKILSKYSNNMELCITMLSQESDKYLYGEIPDSPVRQPMPAHMEPLSIQIPPSSNPGIDLSINYTGTNSPRRERAVTIATPTSNTETSCKRAERHTPVEEYNRKLVKHQQQRLERLLKEVKQDEKRLFDLKSIVAIKNEELVSKKFRVAANPSKNDVDHLEEETQVLREEIDEMTQEIDRVRSLPEPLKKSDSFPRPTHWMNNHSGPMNGPYDPRTCNPWLASQRSHSPERDKSLEGAGWIFVPPDLQPTQPPPPQNTSPEDTEQTWTCRHCTYVNHGALNFCEICERPRTSG